MRKLYIFRVEVTSDNEYFRAVKRILCVMSGMELILSLCKYVKKDLNYTHLSSNGLTDSMSILGNSFAR